MVAELITGLGVFKSLLDTAKGLKDMNDAAVRNTAVIELQENILSAQEQQSALVERVRDLEKEVVRFETWDAEKQRYELTEIANGQFAYSLKEVEQSSEPPHMLCANCYDQNKRSILQTETRNPGRRKVHFCQRCKGEMSSSKTGGRDDQPRPTMQNSGGTWNKSRQGR